MLRNFASDIGCKCFVYYRYKQLQCEKSENSEKSPLLQLRYGRGCQEWRLHVCRQRITVQKTRVAVIHGS
jgi:hypothetical protein